MQHRLNVKYECDGGIYPQRATLIAYSPGIGTRQGDNNQLYPALFVLQGLPISAPGYQ